MTLCRECREPLPDCWCTRRMPSAPVVPPLGPLKRGDRLVWRRPPSLDREVQYYGDTYDPEYVRVAVVWRWDEPARVELARVCDLRRIEP